MKSRFPKLTRIFLVLALMVGVVGSLVPVSQTKAITTFIAPVVAPTTAGKIADYTLTATTTVALAAADAFTFTFPAGTSFAGGNGVLPTGTTIDTPSNAVAAVTSATGAGSGGAAPTIVVVVPALDATAGVTIFNFPVAVGIRNTNTASTTYTISIAKTTGTADATATSAVFTIAGFTVALTPITVNSTAQVTITTAAGPLAGHALAEDIGQIIVTFPAGTTVPASIPASSVIVNATLATAVGAGAAPAPPVVVGRAVTITTPIAVATSGAIVVIFTTAAGILNPTSAAATYQVTVATASNTTPEAAWSSAVYTVTPTIALSPTTGGRSTAITVTGAGYRVSTGVDISYAGAVIASGTSDASGNISIAATVPSASALGAGAVVATDGAGTASAASTFTVTSSLTITPTSGLAGSTITLSGSNWPASTAVFVSVAGVTGTQAGLATSTSATAVTNANGTMQSVSGGQATNTLFLIPQASTPGVKTIAVTVGTQTVTGTFEVTSRVLTISPTSGPVGTTVSISASGLTTSGNALPSIAGVPWSSTTRTLTAATNTTADPAGLVHTVATGTFVVDGVRIGDHVYNSSDANSNCRITAVAATTLTCAVALAGGTLNTWVVGNVAVVVAGTTIDSAGNLNTTLNIAGANGQAIATTNTAGVQTISVTDSGGRIATGTFTITARSIVLAPATGVARSSVQVTGAGWPVNRAVTLTWTNPGVAAQAWGTTTADGSGNIAFIAANLAGAAAALQSATVTAAATTVAGVALTNVISTFTIPAAAITVTPAIGAVGSTVTIAGSGFQPQSPLNVITLGGVQVHPGATIVTDAIGSWTTTVTVPGIAAAISNVSTTVNVTGAPALTRLFEVTAAVASANTQLAGLGTNLVRVWGFSAATQRYQLYDPAAAAASDLPALVRGGGYWINVTAAQTVVIGSNSYALVAGWNLIGYLG